MENTKTVAFNCIGITVRTTNENEQAAKDIGALWQRFMSEGIKDKIPNKVDASIFCLYTDYEGDHTKPYTVVLGCKVENLDNIPKGMIAKTIDSSSYKKFIAKGDITKGAIYDAWLNIWQTNLNRKYTTDYEVYGERAQNPADAEVEIFIAVK